MSHLRAIKEAVTNHPGLTLADFPRVTGLDRDTCLLALATLYARERVTREQLEPGAPYRWFVAPDFLGCD